MRIPLQLAALFVQLLLASLLFVGCGADHGPANCEKEGAGVWRLTYGPQETTTLLSEMGCSPRWQAIDSLAGTAAIPFPIDSIKFETLGGKTYVRFPLDEEEQIFGLGLNFKSVNQRGRTLQLHVDHYGGKDNGRTHAPVPFFVSSKGYGALINSAHYVDVWCGTGVRLDSPHQPEVRDRNTDRHWTASPYSDNIEFLIPAQGVEIILFAGETMLEVVQRYNLYCGGGCLPPKWGLGFWQRVPSLYTSHDVESEVDDFERHGFPLSVVGLEPGWQSASYPCTYQWDSVRYPHPDSLVATLLNKGIRTNLWLNPYISPQSELAQQIAPYSGSHSVWCGLVPDYKLPQTQQLISDYFQQAHLDIGVSGYKMDENDGYDNWLWPDVATFPSGISAEQMRQIYGSLMQKTTADLFRSNNLRTYGLVRAGNAGTNSLPYVIYNDYYNHRDFITALVNSSFIGVLWTPEVRASRTAEEWLRRMQTVCFSPLAMLNAWSDGTKPWSFAEVEQSILDVASLRMQLQPYLYTAFADYHFKGIPPFRAMYLEEGLAADKREEKGKLNSVDNPYEVAKRMDIKDQWMVGPSLMVAPLFEGQTQREVIFPAGRWYDFYTGEYVADGEQKTILPSGDQIPLFVKDGSLIPMFPASVRFEYGKKYPVEVRHYGTAPGFYQLYDDDGLTYDFENGKYARIELSVDNVQQQNGNAKMPSETTSWSYESFYFRFMTQ